MYGGGQPGYGGGQLAPQGFFGNLLGQLAGPAGQALGGLFGQPQIGSQIGQALGGLGHPLPYQVVPGISPAPWAGQPIYGGGQLAPQGFFGNLLGQLAGPAGQALGGLFGQPQIGSQIGQALGGLGHPLPYQVVPGISPAPWAGQPIYGGGQLAPQGFFGNLLGQFAGPAGQALGGLFGQPQIGSQIGQALGGLGHLLPFQAVPIPVPVGLPGGIVPPYLGSPLQFQPVPGVAPIVA